ncbi:LamG-like jellyroll fold domain-containing protein [Flavobacterium chuncheonense]|uniref:LamG-like jellyroll fold domain-containing protein n=1 Tax=Flavobacterium chuncheonense TaxID=2026653 RepID=A0ABW5YPF0_9FLAO
MKKKLLVFAFSAGLFTASYAQKALHFDGVNDYVQTDVLPMTGNTARTVEAWIKTTKNSLPTGQGGLGQSVITDWGSISPNGYRFTFNLLFNNAIRLEVAGNGISGNIAVNDGNWHHVAVVWDPAAVSTSTSVSLYVDGILDVTGNLTVNVNTGATTNLRIGQRIDGTGPFQGSIDEVRVWNFAKTQTQIANDMNTEFCSSQSGLVTYFKFNEGVVEGVNTGLTTINDNSGGNYTGTLNNFALTGTTSNFVAGGNLTLTTVDNTVTNNGGVLTATQTGATYQWVDCDNGNALISGENAQTFSPSVNGNYAVNINLNGCETISNCIQVTSLSSNSFDFNNKITIYPNPLSSILNLNLDETFEEVSVKVINSLGQVVAAQSYSNTNQVSQTVDFSSGVYFVEITTNTGEKAVKRIIKQ